MNQRPASFFATKSPLAAAFLSVIGETFAWWAASASGTSIGWLVYQCRNAHQSHGKRSPKADRRVHFKLTEICSGHVVRLFI